MSTIADLLDKMGIHAASIIPSVAGALIKSSQSPAKSILERIIGVVSGVATAAFMTPLVTQATDLNGAAANGVAFGLGYLGLSVMEVLFEQFTKK